MKNNGFTLIELMIVVAILGIMITILFPIITGQISGSDWGVVCKAGYKFSADAHGYQQQIFDENGRAIPCNKQQGE